MHVPHTEKRRNTNEKFKLNKRNFLSRIMMIKQRILYGEKTAGIRYNREG